MIDLFHPNRRILLELWPVGPLDKISQWTTGSELAWLAEAASRAPMAGEVGSYKGKSARAQSLGAAARHFATGEQGHVVCVDRFQDNTEGDFRHNLREEIQSGLVTILSMESAEGAAECQRLGFQFDFFFIDGSHLKGDVLRDIDIWLPLMKPGGVLAFHDCYPGESDNGISQALEERFPNYHLVIDSIAAVRILGPGVYAEIKNRSAGYEEVALQLNPGTTPDDLLVISESIMRNAK